MNNSSSLARPFWSAAIITLVFTVGLCLLAYVRLNQGALGFAALGTAYSQRDPDGTTGYDGQFAYYIARDGAEAVPYVDGPTLRYMRIVYPLAARAMAFGNAELIPWALLGINIASVAVGAGLTAAIARRLGARRGLSAFAGVVYGLWIGGQFGVRFDLNEPLCMALGLAAICFYRREDGRTEHRYLLVALCLILSTLTKEIGLVFAAGLALHHLFTEGVAGVRQQAGWTAIFLLAPALAFGLWWGILRLWFGTLPTIYPAAQTIRYLPLAGMFTERDTAELVFLILWIGVPAVLVFAWGCARCSGTGA